MTFNFRNLIVLAILCGIISSLSISPQAHRMYTRHMIQLHETATRYISHEQSNDDPQGFVDKIQKSIDTIVQSINPDTPTIIETKNIQSFSFPKSTCEGLTQQQKNQLKQKIKSAKQSVVDFKGKLNEQKDKKVLGDAQNSQKYLTVIELLLNNKCRDIKNLFVGPSPFQTNINTPKPWILGNITMNDLVKDYVKRATLNDNVTNCGTSTPFWTGLKCVDCKDPTPVFNIATGECIKCPDGTVYDSLTKKCIPGGNFKPNAVAEKTSLVPKDAPQNALKDYLNTGKEPCPEDKPHVKQNTCIVCPPQKPFFNIIVKQCQGPNSTDVPVQNPKLKMNFGSPDKVWTDYVENNKNKVLCPTISPFWNGEKCIPCPDLFNIETLKCDVCQGGQKLNQTTHKCEPANPLEPHLIDLFNAIF